MNKLSADFPATVAMGVYVTITTALNDGGNIGVFCAATGENHFESATVGVHRWAFTTTTGTCFVYSWLNSTYRAGLSGAGTYSMAVPGAEPPPAAPGANLTYPGVPGTDSPTMDNRLTGYFSPTTGSTVSITISTAMNDGGNIGVYCTSNQENHFGPGAVGVHNYAISGGSNCYVYSWLNSTYRAWLSGAGTFTYTAQPPPTPTPAPTATPVPTPTPVPTATPLPGSEPTLGSSWNGQYQGGLAPPDPTGAMGMDRYVEFINLRYGIYDRSGSLVSGSGAQGDLGAMTGLPVSELSDPQIVWDPGSQRFYYSVLDVARLGLAFGYSTVPNPSSSSDFCHYILDFGYGSTLTLPDYPKMAVTSDYVLFGVNTFFFLSVYQGSDVDWVHKPTSSSCPASIDGGKFATLRNADSSYLSTPVPAVNADPSSTGWVVGSVDASTAGSGSVLSVFSVTKGGDGDPVLTGPMTIPVAAYSVPASIPQAGTSATLDSLDSRLTHAVAAFDPRIGASAIWTSHAVFGGAGSEQRWYEIRTDGTPALAQSGAVTSPTVFVWNGAVSPNRANDGVGNGAFGSDMVLGFNTSSASSYPGLQMVSKRGSNGQSNWVPVTQATGPNVDSSCGPVCRWGDYAGAVPDPDPNAGGQVWLSGEWNLPATNGTDNVWRTWNWAATP